MKDYLLAVDRKRETLLQDQDENSVIPEEIGTHLNTAPQEKLASAAFSIKSLNLSMNSKDELISMSNNNKTNISKIEVEPLEIKFTELKPERPKHEEKKLELLSNAQKFN